MMNTSLVHTPNYNFVIIPTQEKPYEHLILFKAFTRYGIYETIGTLGFNINCDESKSRVTRWRYRLSMKGVKFIESKIELEALNIRIQLEDKQRFSKKLSRLYNTFNNRRNDIAKKQAMFKNDMLQGLIKELKEAEKKAEEIYGYKVSDYIYNSKPNLTPFND